MQNKKDTQNIANTFEDLIPQDQSSNYKNSNFQKLWQKELQEQGFPVDLPSLKYSKETTPEERGFIRFVLISDTHTMHNKIAMPEGDVLLHTGDFTFMGLKHKVECFNKWLASLPYEHKVVIAGNHEFTFDLGIEFQVKNMLSKSPDYDPTLPHKDIKNVLQDCIYLEDEEIELYGYKIYGTPWQYIFHKGAFQREEEERVKIFSKIPEDVDILMTHTPPSGVLDLLYDGKSHVGDTALKTVLDKRNFLINCFGHIHEDYGALCDEKGRIFVNSSALDENYRVKHKPVVFDLPFKSS